MVAAAGGELQAGTAPVEDDGAAGLSEQVLCFFFGQVAAGFIVRGLDHHQDSGGMHVGHPHGTILVLQIHGVAIKKKGTNKSQLEAWARSS